MWLTRLPGTRCNRGPRGWVSEIIKVDFTKQISHSNSMLRNSWLQLDQQGMSTLSVPYNPLTGPLKVFDWGCHGCDDRTYLADKYKAHVAEEGSSQKKRRCIRKGCEPTSIARDPFTQIKRERYLLSCHTSQIVIGMEWTLSTCAVYLLSTFILTSSCVVSVT